MGLARTMSVDRQKRALVLAAALLTLALGGCSSPIADMPSLETPTADAAVKPKDAYLPVHDIPPERDESLIPPDQRARIEAELAAARDRQASATQNSGAK